MRSGRFPFQESYVNEPIPKASGTEAPRPALRLVNTNELSREDWLDVRKGGIGSSDAGAAVGLNPYKSQLELWLEKTGQDAELPKVDPNDESSPMYWGTLLEPIVAAHYTKRTGNRVRRINAVLQHPKHEWMLANIDREVIGAGDVQILECKTAGINGAKLWRDGPPEYVQLQVQHQLAVTGKQAADVACLVCGNELRVYRIERDETLIGRLIELEQAFWNLVVTNTAPAPDGSDSADTALRALYPRDTGATVDYSADLAMSGLFSNYLDARQALADAEAREAQLKQRIQLSMGDATKAVFEQGAVSWKRSQDGTAIDTPKLLKDRPRWLEPYVITRSGSRRFNVLV
jgi:putative phage-type endonuclease